MGGTLTTRLELVNKEVARLLSAQSSAALQAQTDKAELLLQAQKDKAELLAQLKALAAAVDPHLRPPPR